MSELSKACFCLVMIADVGVVSMRVLTERPLGILQYETNRSTHSFPILQSSNMQELSHTINY